MKRMLPFILPLLIGCGNQSKEVNRTVTWHDDMTETRYSDWNISPAREYIDCHKKDKEDGVFDVLVVNNRRTHLLDGDLKCASSFYNYGDQIIPQGHPDYSKLQLEFRQAKLRYKSARN